MRPIGIAIALLFLSLSAYTQANEPWAGTYVYDGAGNVKAIGQNRYVYDGVRRLRQATAITPVQQNVQQYTYDAFGNLLSSTIAGDPAQALSVGVNHATNRASDPNACPPNSSCFLASYDESGNQTAFGSTSYVYDSSGMVTELSATGRQQFYVYDIDDQRVVAVAYNGVSSQTWHYSVRDMSTQVVREVDDVVSGTSHSFSWKEDYVRPGRLLAALKSGTSGETTLHFHLDHLGTPRLLTNDVGRRVSVHTYWPFGREAAGSDPDDEVMKFTGHERDTSGDGNDLDYMHARYYSSVAGRFLSVDPLLGRPLEPQSWNRYTYVLNDPLNRTDPDGRADNRTAQDKAILESPAVLKAVGEARANVGFGKWLPNRRETGFEIDNRSGSYGTGNVHTSDKNAEISFKVYGSKQNRLSEMGHTLVAFFHFHPGTGYNDSSKPGQRLDQGASKQDKREAVENNVPSYVAQGEDSIIRIDPNGKPTPVLDGQEAKDYLNRATQAATPPPPPPPPPPEEKPPAT